MNSIKTMFKNAVPYEKDSPRKREIDRKLALFIARDFQPLNVVADRGFCNLLKKLDKRYKIPSRRTVTDKLIPELYREARERLQSTLDQVNSVALTIDAWTSVSNKSFLGITAHYFDKNYTLHARALDVIEIKTDETAEELGRLVKSSLDEWHIFEKVHHIVTDSASNMICMVKNHLKKKHFPCIAHVLNLIVDKTLNKLPAEDPVTIAISKCKHLATFFHHSPKATRLLENANRNSLEPGELQKRKIIQYVSILFS